MSKHRYEGLLVLNVKGKEDGAQKIIDRIEKDFKAEGCEIESVQKMDTRHFSYAPGKLDSGFFVNFVFAAAPDTLPKLQARFKLDEDVYRQQYGRLSDKKKSV
jgi:small subunit ribosomal protein S6